MLQNFDPNPRKLYPDLSLVVLVDYFADEPPNLEAFIVWSSDELQNGSWHPGLYIIIDDLIVPAQADDS